MATQGTDRPEIHRQARGTTMSTPTNGGGKASVSSTRTARGRLRVALTRALAVFGVTVVALAVVGIVADYRGFDRTRGGYEPPYTGFTGEPIDWSEAYVTGQGFFDNNYVLDTHVDCTTGMITFDLFGLRFDYRTFSERALAVHRPREACTAAGFAPQF